MSVLVLIVTLSVEAVLFARHRARRQRMTRRLSPLR
jgi:hypothetical protein